MEVSDWPKRKTQAGLVSALSLLTVSFIGFSAGLQFGGEFGWIVGTAVWIALTIIQFIGNDSSAHDDWIFTVGWVFTYILGIGASTWAMYLWINIPNESLRWVVAFGLGGAIEVLPERLVYKFVKTLKSQAEVQVQKHPHQQLHGVNGSMKSDHKTSEFVQSFARPSQFTNLQGGEYSRPPVRPPQSSPKGVRPTNNNRPSMQSNNNYSDDMRI